MHDGGHARKGSDGHSDCTSKPVIRGILVDIDAGQDADRRDQCEGYQHEVEGSHKRKPDSTGLSEWAGVLGDIIPRENWSGLDEKVDDHREHWDDDRKGRCQHQVAHNLFAQALPALVPAGGEGMFNVAHI